MLRTLLSRITTSSERAGSDTTDGIMSLTSPERKAKSEWSPFFGGRIP